MRKYSKGIGAVAMDGEAITISLSMEGMDGSPLGTYNVTIEGDHFSVSHEDANRRIDLTPFKCDCDWTKEFEKYRETILEGLQREAGRL